ncbi:MAG TPA: hypothetical protein VI278_11005 [Nitrososphaeraceae archaeon]
MYNCPAANILKLIILFDDQTFGSPISVTTTGASSITRADISGLSSTSCHNCYFHKENKERKA